MTSMVRLAAFAAALLVASVALGACRATTGAGSTGPAIPRPSCAPSGYWNGSACVPHGPGAKILAEGESALAKFQAQDALGLLEKARAAGPHPHDEYAKVFEQLGIAHAYLGQEQPALAAFDMLLSLDPGHLLSYTLSPKATFLFERARRAAQRGPRPELAVSWDHRALDVAHPVSLFVDVVADPRRFLDRATIYTRRRGQTRYQAIDVALPPPGQSRKVVLPALDLARPAVLQLYVSAFDARGNEVLRWGDAADPRDVPLSYTPPTPWYRNWRIYALAGAVVAAGVGVGVYVATHQPPSTVGGPASGGF